jgi:small subunit ribosomal protein S24e
MADVSSLKSTALGDGSVLHVTVERTNKIIGRIEVFGIVTHMGKGTPTRAELKAALAQLYSKDAKLVVIKYIKSEYGMGRSKIKAHIYDDEERLRLFEPEYILKRGG